jgi:hypothetical protein
MEGVGARHRAVQPQYRYSNGWEICQAIERFAHELYRLPAWWAELERRATLIELRCGPDSPFHLAMGAAWSRWRQAPAKPFGPEPSGAKVALHDLRQRKNRRPALLGEVTDLRGELELLIDSVHLTARIGAAFQKWLDECCEIQREAERLEVDGCYYLYHVYLASRPNPSRTSRFDRAMIQSGGLGGPALEWVLAAADSLFAWAQESSVIQADVRKQCDAVPKKPGLTASEFNVLARDYLKDHAKPDHRVTIRELQAHLKAKNPAGTCSLATVSRLPAWRAYRDKLELSGQKGKKGRPKAVPLTKKVEATTGRPDEELQRLIQDQRADDEPSPLEEDLPDQPPRRVRQRKRV